MAKSLLCEAPCLLLTVLRDGLLNPAPTAVLGIITANERAHALLVLFGAAGIFFNLSRL